MKKWTMLVDVALCHDCNNCFLACKDEFVGNDWRPYAAAQPWHGHRWIDLIRKEDGQFPKVRVTYLPLLCQQCEDGPCQSAGPPGAVYRRDDGVVVIDPDKVAGAEEIVGACPYGAVYWNEDEQLAQKCNGCVHLLEAGWKDTRCTQACPTGALQLRFLDEAETEKLKVDEGYEEYLLGLTRGHRVLYKNLHRWTKLFLAGGVVAADTDDCVEGARVVLRRGDHVVTETTTDAFGDFTFDSLEPAADYAVSIQLAGYSPREAEIDLIESFNLGSIPLQRMPA
jgi:Fe-S-cluster-containing dehydrogenase component